MATAHPIPRDSSFTWQLSVTPACRREHEEAGFRSSYLQRRLLHWREGLLALALASGAVFLWFYFLGRVF